jgi:polar amino acid transport system substrate-binding protein
MIYTRLVSLICLILLILLSDLPHANALIVNDSAVNAKLPHLTVVTEHLPPFQTVAKDYKLTGFTVDIVKQALVNSPYSFTIQANNWVRSYNLAMTKANHCIFTIARLKSREKKFQWVGPITKNFNASVWGLKKFKKRHNIKKISDLKGFVTAVNQYDASHIGMVEQGFIEGKNLYLHKNSKSLLNLLQNRDEIDFIIADDISISHRATLANVDINNLYRVIELEDLPLNFYLACSLKTDKQVVENLRKQLANVYKSQSYQQILQKWHHAMPNYHKP